LTAEPEVFYVLDRTGVRIEGESHNPDDVLVGLNNSSDFISHRLLINFYNYRNSREIDLWQVFERDVIPFLKTNRGRGEKTLNTLYNEIVNNRPYRLLGNGNIELKRVSNDYTNKIQDFNTDLDYWVSEINTDINDFYESHFQSDSENKLQISLELKENLRYDFAEQIRQVDVSEFTFKSKDLKEIQYPFVKLSISVEKDDGTFKQIDRPQSFLNEAKLTAIALSVRFVLLQPHIRPAFTGRILGLDDLLISLDMSNRMNILNILFDKFSENYQLLIFTHDKSFFELAKNKIRFNGKTDIWNFIEMYQDDTGVFSKPYFKPLKNNIQTAEDFLIQHDYAACGIYLRTEIETKLRALLPENLKKEQKTKDGVTSLFDKNLNDLIHAFKIFCLEENIDFTPFNDLKTYKDLLLNPLAHNDIDAPFFRDELTSLIKITKDLNKIKRGQIFHRSNKNMNFVLNKPDGTYYSVRMKSAEQIILLEEEGKTERISIYSKCKVSSVDNNGVITNEAEQFDTVKDCYIEMCNRFGIEPSNDLSNVFDYDGKDFNEKLIEINGE